MDTESLVMKTPQFNEKYTANRVFANPGYMGGGITTLTGLMKGNVEGFQMMPIPYPTLEEGAEPIIATREFAYNGSGVAITTACENVQRAVEMLDYGYGEEGSKLLLFGVEGEAHTLVDGVPTYTDLILKNPDGLSNLQAMAKYCYWQSSAPVVKYGDVVNQRDSLPEQIEGRKNWIAVKSDRLLPQVYPTAEESNELASIMANVDIHVQDMFAQFISGQRSLDEFDAYDEELKGMDIDRAIEITQTQVDNYANKP
jgi:putative aldouronate transport system substrate-binding protein